MKIKRIPAGIYAANCYILIDEDTKEAAVIDPGGDADDIIKAVNDEGVVVKYILLTHGHTDHTGGAEEIKREYNAPIYISKEDYNMIEEGQYMYGEIAGKIDGYIEESETFEIGKLKIKFIHTPGHTPGGMCFLVNGVLFTGDTLFAGSIGRTDFAGGDFDTIIKSIKNKLMILPEDTNVLPGHGAESTIGREKVHNPFL